MDDVINEASLAEISRAHEIMAGISLYVLHTPEISAEHRFLVLGNYLITCAMVRQTPAHESLEPSFVDGLVAAGGDEDEARELSTRLTTIRRQRIIFALAHIPDSQKGYGIIRSRRGVTLDENDFVHSILHLAEDS